MTSISANTLKTQGVSAIAEALTDALEATVSVRGKDRFVVMDIAHYRYLRECELVSALELLIRDQQIVPVSVGDPPSCAPECNVIQCIRIVLEVCP